MRGSRAWAVRRAAALAAVVALAACGGGSVPAPVTTSAPPAAVSALPAGTYTSVVFEPAVTFTLPDGWAKTADQPSYLALYPAGNDLAGIHLFRDPLPASQAETCPTTAEPGVGTLSSELSAWIRDRPGLDVSAPRMVSVGGLRGVELDLRIRAGWVVSCPFANGVPTAPLFVGRDGGLRWVVAGSERLRLSLLDVPGGGTVVVDIDAFADDQWDALLAAARPIVASMEFAAD